MSFEDLTLPYASRGIVNIMVITICRCLKSSNRPARETDPPFTHVCSNCGLEFQVDPKNCEVTLLDTSSTPGSSAFKKTPRLEPVTNRTSVKPPPPLATTPNKEPSLGKIAWKLLLFCGVIVGGITYFGVFLTYGDSDTALLWGIGVGCISGIWASYSFTMEEAQHRQGRERTQFDREEKTREASRQSTERRLEEQHERELGMNDVDAMSGIEFEKYVAGLLRHQGFTVKLTPGSNDFGVDIIADRGDLGKFAIQVKRQASQVSRSAVSDAVAGKTHYDCDKAAVVTNNYFSNGAKTLAKTTECQLIDRDKLKGWIENYAVVITTL